jgi:hypothetical protein
MRGSELATGIAARYDKLAERCWILTLVGGWSTETLHKCQRRTLRSRGVHLTKVRETLRERGYVSLLHEFVPISR